MRASARAAGALGLLLCGGCETVYGPTSPSVEWAAFESPRYTLSVRPGSFCESQAAALAELLEDQYSHTVGTLQIEMGGRIAMFLYNSGGELNPALPFWDDCSELLQHRDGGAPTGPQTQEQPTHLLGPQLG